MALVNAYCTVEELRAHLSDVDSRLTTDTLERAITAASRGVDEWCGRRFWTDPAPVARTFRPEGRCVVEVGDISTTVGLVVETDPSYDGSWSQAWTLDADFELGPDNADADGGAYAWTELRSIGGRRWPIAERRTLRVTARWGWSQVPGQVTSATILRAAALFTRKDSPAGVSTFGDFAAVRISRRDPDVIELLTPFQRVMA